MKRMIALLAVVSTLTLGAVATTAEASPQYFQPGTTCSVHWNPDGTLRIKLVNNTSRGGYVHCLYKTWGNGQPTLNWNSSIFVGAYRYRYMVNGRYVVRQSKWARVTGSYIR